MALNLENILKQVGKNTEWAQPEMVKEAKGLSKTDDAAKILAAMGIGAGVVGGGVVLNNVFNTPSAPQASVVKDEPVEEKENTVKKDDGPHLTPEQQAALDTTNTPNIQAIPEAPTVINVQDDGSGTTTESSADTTTTTPTPPPTSVADTTTTTTPPPSNTGESHINTELNNYYNQVQQTQDTTAIGKKKRETEIQELNNLLKLNSYQGATKADIVFYKMAKRRNVGPAELVGRAAGEVKNQAENVWKGGKKVVQGIKKGIGRAAHNFKKGFKAQDQRNESKPTAKPTAQPVNPAGTKDQVQQSPQTEPSPQANRMGTAAQRVGKAMRDGKKTDTPQPSAPAPSMEQPRPQAEPMGAAPMSKAGSVMAKLATKKKDGFEYTYQGNPYKHEPGDPRFNEIASSMNLDPKLYNTMIADTTNFKDNVGTGREMTHWAIPKDLTKYDPVLQRKQEANFVGDQDIETMGNYIQWLKDNKRPVTTGKK